MEVPQISFIGCEFTDNIRGFVWKHEGQITICIERSLDFELQLQIIKELLYGVIPCEGIYEKLGKELTSLSFT